MPEELRTFKSLLAQTQRDSAGDVFGKSSRI